MQRRVAEKTPTRKKKRGPGRPRNSGREGQDDPRSRLLAVAVKVFSQHGYDAVSTGDVAREAGLSQPMVHYHFGSKEQLWRAAMHHLMREIGQRYPTNAADLKDLDPVSRLKVITRRFISRSAQDPTLTMIITHESLANTDRLQWLVETYVRAGFQEFDEALTEGMEAGVIKEIPLHVLANTIVSASSFTFCLNALVKACYGVDLSEPDRIQEMSDGLTEILFHGLIRDPDPAAS